MIDKRIEQLYRNYTKEFKLAHSILNKEVNGMSVSVDERLLYKRIMSNTNSIICEIIKDIPIETIFDSIIIILLECREKCKSESILQDNLYIVLSLYDLLETTIDEIMIQKIKTYGVGAFNFRYLDDLKELLSYDLSIFFIKNYETYNTKEENVKMLLLRQSMSSYATRHILAGDNEKAILLTRPTTMPNVEPLFSTLPIKKSIRELLFELEKMNNDPKFNEPDIKILLIIKISSILLLIEYYNINLSDININLSEKSRKDIQFISKFIEKYKKYKDINIQK